MEPINISSAHQASEEDGADGKPAVKTPLPWKTMAILGSVIISEPISLTILFPFIFFMVKDFGYKEEDVGYYVGYIASSFSLAQLFTAMWWGWLSDKIGRRPVLLIGLIGNSISTCFFGLSKSLIWAILSRSACGLLNGNIGVAKSVLGEITDRSNQGAAFALIGLNYGIGLIIGPALGGMLSHPVQNYPLLFDGRGNVTEFFIQYPYFLPCAISSIISWIGFFFGYFNLPETCAHLISGYKPVPTSERLAQMDDEEDVELFPDSFIQDTTAVVDIPEDIVGSNETLNVEVQSNSRSSIGLQAIASSLSYCLLAFQNIIFTEVFPLWAVSKPNIGLGFDAQQIGFLFSCLGIVAIICQLLIYPYASTIYSPLKLFKYPLVGLLAVFLLLPLISTFLAPSIFVWPSLFFAMGVRSVLENVIFTSVMLLINNSAKPGQLGFVNGIAQGAASFARAIGPATGGSLWAWSNQNSLPYPFNHHFIFFFILLIICLLILQSFTMLIEQSDHDE